MSREWERGRLAHAAGKPKTANPHRRGARGWAAWLSGWLYQSERFPELRISAGDYEERALDRARKA
jgi:hypothetical protein